MAQQDDPRTARPDGAHPGPEARPGGGPAQSAQPGQMTAWGTAGRTTGAVRWPAVLAIVVVSVLGGMLVLADLVLALVSSIGPDSCEEVSCSGDEVLEKVFFALAAIGAVATVGTWFTARPSRRTARYVLSFIAIGVPVFGSLIALGSAPDWMV